MRYLNHKYPKSKPTNWDVTIKRNGIKLRMLDVMVSAPWRETHNNFLLVFKNVLALTFYWFSIICCASPPVSVITQKCNYRCAQSTCHPNECFSPIQRCRLTQLIWVSNDRVCVCVSQDFLLQIFTVFRILIRPEMFSKDWTVMRLVTNK